MVEHRSYSGDTGSKPVPSLLFFPKERIAMNSDIIPHIEYPSRKIEALYNEMNDEDGKLYSTQTKITWDDSEIELSIKIPMVFSYKRIYEIFQSLLDETLRVKEQMCEKSILL